MSELVTAFDYLIDARNTLQRTARDQDLVDGGDGKVVYHFTLYDAMSTNHDWGESGSRSDLNVRVLFNDVK